MPFNWLHISDVHLEPFDDYGRDIVLRTLVSTARQHRERGREIDAIFVTGDIVSHGRSEAYAHATRLFDDLCAATRLERRQVFVVPGNHDVDRRRGGFLARTLSSAEESDRYFAPGQSKYHFERLEHYRAWYDNYFAGIRSFSTDSTCGPVEILGLKGIRVGVLPVNTALFCADDHDHENLWVGRRCMDTALDSLQAMSPDLSIALLHHPLSFLHSGERSRIRDRLQRSVDVILRGHLHETDIQSIVTSSGAALHFAAGSAYVRADHPKLALFGRAEGPSAFVLPLRYFSEVESWHSDPTIFPEADRNEGCLPLPKRDTAARIAPAATRERVAAVEQAETSPSHTVEELGKWTVAAARRDEGVLGMLPEITGQTRAWVDRQLNDTDGRTRLRKTFGEHWPGGSATRRDRPEDPLVEDDDEAELEDDEVEEEEEELAYCAEDLADRTVASARDDDEAIDALADITNLARRWVKRLINAADGRTRLRTVFADRWPSDEDETQSTVSAAELAGWTAAAARNDRVAIDSLVEITGQAREWISEQLVAADGRRRLHRLFAEYWPRTEDGSQAAGDEDESVELHTADELADWTVAAARDDQVAIDSLVTITGIPRLRVARNLRDADGRYRLKTLFASSWPSEEDEAQTYSAADLADNTVASAREDDDIIDSLAELTSIDRRWVKRYLNGADGRTRLRTLFAERWPTDGAVEEPPLDVRELGDSTAASVRGSESAVAAIVECTGMTAELVRDRLQGVDGRMRVRNVFDDGWPAEVDPAEVEELAQRTVASVRGDEPSIEAIGRITDIRPRGIRRRLARVDGRSRISTVFADYWPD